MKLIIVILTLSCLTAFLQEPIQSKQLSEVGIPTSQKEAFKVLQANCNVCHISKNPSKIFTIENMNGFAKRINRQVFIWKRMPKGRKNDLSKKQKEILKTWINSQ